MTDDPLTDEQMHHLMQAFIDIEADDPSPDDAFARTAQLFNCIYRMGQQHERLRWAACSFAIARGQRA